MIERTNSDVLVENKLPDGSRVLVDSRNERVIALNAMAGAAWDACSQPSTLPQVAEAMRSSLGTEVAEDVAKDAILQLQEHSLVKSSDLASVNASRRAFITRLGAAALPIVVAMTMSEQRAYATGAWSNESGPAWNQNGGDQGNGSPIGFHGDGHDHHHDHHHRHDH